MDLLDCGPEHLKKADAQTIETSKNKIYIRDLK